MTAKPNRIREILQSVCVSLAVATATLAVLEVVLRIADFKELRETLTEHSLGYAYDPELGWMPAPDSSGQIVTFRRPNILTTASGCAMRSLRWIPNRRSCFWETHSSGVSMPRRMSASPSC